MNDLRRPGQTTDQRPEDSLDAENTRMMAERTAAARATMSEAYAANDAAPDVTALQKQAATYDPSKDAGIERLKAMPDGFLTPQMRMVVGPHESAKAAAQQLDKLGASRRNNED